MEPEIAQAMVHGDKRPHLVSLLVPDADFAADWATANNADSNLASLIENIDFIKTIDRAVDRVNANLGVIEQVRRFALTANAFTIDNEQMTPTLKVRRHVITEVYRERLEGLYH